MKDQILKYIQKIEHVSFQELAREIDGFSGELPMPLPGYENIIVWHALSQKAGQSLIELLISEEIYAHPFKADIAFAEGGEFPSFPIAKTLKHYTSPHWFPMTLTTKSPD